jgi:hypothetical protein
MPVAREADVIEDLRSALLETQRATEMNPKVALYWNTRAAIFEAGARIDAQFANAAAQVLWTTPGMVPQPSESESIQLRRAYEHGDPHVLLKEGCAAARAVSEAGLLVCHAPRDCWKDQAILRRCWKDQAIEAYGHAFDLALRQDLQQRMYGPRSGPLSAEAGSSYLKLVKERGARPEEQGRVTRVEASIKRVEALPHAITPIVLSLESKRSLSELVSTRTVTFDFDGSGRPTRWSWVQPTAGILVWDPGQAEQIVSGRQLIGTVAFDMFWRSGYAVLDALDDNRDGVLTGEELTGLAVWFDRNSNGVSEPGEISAIEDTGIAALATSPNGHDGASLMNTAGLRLKDGRLLPTYDWISQEVSTWADDSMPVRTGRSQRAPGNDRE